MTELNKPAIKPEFETLLDAQTARAMGRIGVLYGGLSHERQVSLWSGEAVYNALKNAGLDVVLIDVKEDFLDVLAKKPFDYAFPVLHGRGGEDGTIQAMLEWQHIPYVGSGVLASAIAMDKVRTKQIWQAVGLPVLPQTILNEGFDIDEVIAKIGLPIAVKPALEGSSNGVTKVTSREALLPAFEQAKQHGGAVMAEQWVEGKEYTAAMIGKQVMPLIRIRVDGGIYDFQTKYVTGATEYLCPCGLLEAEEKALQALVFQAAEAIGTRDWCRVDLMVDNDNRPWLIEINTLPGMTETSLVPKAVKVAGMNFTETVLTILKNSWETHHA